MTDLYFMLVWRYESLRWVQPSFKSEQNITANLTSTGNFIGDLQKFAQILYLHPC